MVVVQMGLVLFNFLTGQSNIVFVFNHFCSCLIKKKSLFAFVVGVIE